MLEIMSNKVCGLCVSRQVMSFRTIIFLCCLNNPLRREMQRSLLHFIALRVRVRMLFLLTMVYLVVQLEDHAPLRSFRTSRHGRVDCPVVHLHATCLHLWEVSREELEGTWMRVRVSGRWERVMLFCIGEGMGSAVW